jgi:class 3 adenylate cyclase
VNTPDPAEGAIAFTDLVGFTEFTAARGDAEAVTVLGTQERIVNAALPAGARVVKELGDGMLLFLPDTASALAVCLEILAGFDRAADADEMPLWVRAGLHWGRAARRGDDLIGHDVNVAARIVDVAAPGELLCSGAMMETGAPHDESIEFVELGPVVMKGIPDPIDLYRVERADISLDDPVPVER